MLQPMEQRYVRTTYVLKPLSNGAQRFPENNIFTPPLIPSQPNIRPNLPPLEPNLLIPLPNPKPDMRKRTQLQLPAERLADRAVPNSTNRPIDRYARRLRQPGWNGEGKIVQDFTRGMALVVSGGVQVRDEHGGAGERGVEGEGCGGGDEVHGCGLDEVVSCWGLVVVVAVAVVGVFGVREVRRGEGDGVF